MEDDLRGKTTFYGRRPLEEDNLVWKMTFDGRGLLAEDFAVEDDLQWKTTFAGSLHAAYSALWHFLIEEVLGSKKLI